MSPADSPKTKVRLVARPHEQRVKVDFWGMFVLIVAVLSVQWLAALAGDLRLDLDGLDIEQAFVELELGRNVSIRLSQGSGSW